jgi:hypothetical protein
MKIVSRFKDYYDHLVGKYGYDEKVIYTRKTIKHNKSSYAEKKEMIYKTLDNFVQREFSIFDLKTDKYCLLMYLVIGSRVFKGLIYQNNIKWNLPKEEIEELPNYIKYYYQNTDIIQVPEDVPVFMSFKCLEGDIKHRSFSLENPNLSMFKVVKILSAEDCYVEIYNKLIKTKDVPDNMTNKEKILSHGFDLKKSFRKR